MIGEKINPTGRKKLAEALAIHDYEYIRSLAHPADCPTSAWKLTLPIFDRWEAHLVCTAITHPTLVDR